MRTYAARLFADGEALTEPLKRQDTAELLDLLCDADEATRHGAAMVLQRRGEPEALERALELVRSDRPELRDTAAFLLGQLGYRAGYPFRDRSVPVLMELLPGDPSPLVRASAASALGYLDATCALEALIEAAADEDAQVRISVATSLGRLALPECVPVLETMCDDHDHEVAEWARTGMEVLIGRRFEGRTVPELLEILTDAAREPLSRQVAADILAQKDGPSACEHGYRMCMDADEAIRCSAAYLLAGAASWHRDLREDAVPFLVDMLRHESSVAVRCAAAEGLAQLGESVVRSVLAEAASDSDSVIRACASWALKRISAAESRATPLLDRLLGTDGNDAGPAPGGRGKSAAPTGS